MNYKFPIAVRLCRLAFSALLPGLFGLSVFGQSIPNAAVPPDEGVENKAGVASQVPVAKSPEVLEQEAYFVEQVLPLLEQNCFECHSHVHNDSSGELMLDSLAAMLRGGTRGAALVPSDSANSLLWRALTHTDSDLQMPPSARLSDNQVAVFERWIQGGAHVPDAMRGMEATDGQAAAKLGENHWAYQPPQRWQATGVASDGSIDEIIQLGLKSQSLSMSPAADRRTLAVRLSYDLIGLPPSLEEIAAVEQDPRADEQVLSELIDRLLASEHFGERWARYWMDVSRYADTKGYVFQEDREYPGAYQYRDWLINAFNQDMPYDQFVTKQLAADLVSPSDAQSDLPALGFLTLGRRFLNNKLDIIDDRLDVVSRGLMGMTLGCARCHDHKYDPISQADYYAMSGVFLNTDEPGGEPWPHRLKDSEESRESFILVRGSPGNRGDKVDRRFVTFLAPEEKVFAEGSGRVELAREITAADNPLTARVMANRIWLRLTGSSLVESPSDLGTRCPPPAQLALLDHLATSFVDEGWSVKGLIRRIALSKTYQQQSLDRAEASAIDPENVFYWRMNRRRLDFEAFRDTLLARGKLLDPTVRGPSQKIDGTALMRRRTVYAYIDRQNLPSVFRTFDFASPDTHNSQRALTSVPQQGLFVLNSTFVTQVAEELGKQASQQELAEVSHGDSHTHATADTATDKDTNRRNQVQGLFRSILARDASAQELQLAAEFLSQADVSPTIGTQARWVCGFGKFNPDTKTLESFQPLPTFTDGRWQASRKFPDDALGYLLLSAEGGHVGRDLEHAAVRRWIAPRDGVIVIRGKLKHEAAEGDGVRGSILLSNAGPIDASNVPLGEWIAKQEEQRTGVKATNVRAGDTIDFVADCIGSDSHDSFHWTVRVQYTDGAGETFVSKDGLPTPQLAPLDRWSQLAQILLATNELAYVD